MEERWPVPLLPADSLYRSRSRSISLPGHGSQVLVYSDPGLLPEHPQWITCFIFGCLVSAHFWFKKTLRSQDEEFLILLFFFMQLWVILCTGICNPRRSHHWSGFFISSKILEITNRGFEMFALEKKRREDQILVTSTLSWPRNGFLKAGLLQK